MGRWDNILHWAQLNPIIAMGVFVVVVLGIAYVLADR